MCIALMPCSGRYLVLLAHRLLCAHALGSTGASVDQAVSLERLVILNMFRETGKGVSGRGAFGAAHERHCGGVLTESKEGGSAKKDNYREPAADAVGLEIMKLVGCKE